MLSVVVILLRRSIWNTRTCWSYYRGQQGLGNVPGCCHPIGKDTQLSPFSTDWKNFMQEHFLWSFIRKSLVVSDHFILSLYLKLDHILNNNGWTIQKHLEIFGKYCRRPLHLFCCFMFYNLWNSIVYIICVHLYSLFPAWV